MKSLSIAEGVSLPEDTSTQSITILAKRRVGKSYLGRRIWEQLLKKEQHVVFIDPKGDQWGIRSSADGKSPGFPVLILGGEHGDLPLEKDSGELVARLVVEQHVNALIDTSHFSKTARATFMAQYLELLYRLKAQEKYRTPLCNLIDEADEIAPQRPQKGEERMLGAIDDIVRRGGQRGLGTILITQRSAMLNKNVLTQSEMIILLRTIAPQDLAAVKAWIDVHGTPEQRETIMAELPSLPRGDAYFWAPAWPTDEGMFKRAHVLPIETFDSAKTPEIGEKRIIPKSIADVDIDALKGQMAATIEKARADDPKMLRKKIVDLEHALAVKKAVMPAKVFVPDTRAVDHAVKIAVSKRDQEWEAKLREGNKEIKRLAQIIHKVGQVIGTVTPVDSHAVISSPEKMIVTVPDNLPTPVHAGPRPPKDQSDHLRPNDDWRGVHEEEVTGPEQRILDGIAWMESIGVSKPPNEIVAFLSGYAHSRSTGYTNPRGFLRSKALIELSDGRVELTRAGREVAKPQERPPTQEDLHQVVLDKLAGPERKLLKPLLDHPDGMSNTDLCAAAGYLHERSTGYTNPRGRLKSFGLIKYDDGLIKPSQILFI